MVEIEEVEKEYSKYKEEETPKKVAVQKKQGQKRPSKTYADIVYAQDGDKEKKDAGLGDIYQILTLALGAMCYFYRIKFFAWACLFIFYSSIINMRFDMMM